MTFTVIDKETGREVSDDVAQKIAKNGGLMEMDINQFAVCEDGSIILLDDCGNIAYCDQGAFGIRIDSTDGLVNESGF